LEPFVSFRVALLRTPNDAPEAPFLRSNRRIDQNYFRFKAKSLSSRIAQRTARNPCVSVRSVIAHGPGGAAAADASKVKVDYGPSGQ
jgi:hypothetical protein